MICVLIDLHELAGAALAHHKSGKKNFPEFLLLAGLRIFTKHI